MARAIVALLLLFAAVPTLPTFARAAPAPGTCSAWGCDAPATAPLAWTRPGGGGAGLDLSRSGDLCERHAEKLPFALTTRFALMFGLVPAALFGYATWRILYVVDSWGDGLTRIFRYRARAAFVGLPIATSLLWLLFFAARAW